MKGIIRSLAVHLLALYAAMRIDSGFIIRGGFTELVYAAVFLTLINIFIKPFLKILFLPINMITLGFFSWVINIMALFLLTLIVKQIQILTWHFAGLSSHYISLPSMTLSPTLNFVFVALLIAFITKLLHWIEK